MQAYADSSRRGAPNGVALGTVKSGSHRIGIVLVIVMMWALMAPIDVAAASWIRPSQVFHTSVGTPEVDIPAASGYDITPVIVSVVVGVGATVCIALFSRWVRSRNSTFEPD